uniref:ATP synthase F0 subunit 8 n=1 Tax=Platygaster sp. ZJUH_2016029 TaxID=2496284 RepID=A0A3S8V182_9HYME|nr:ATP synthase F0 subunit 8 [Platygaster sp. ZJUH_2016029]
MPQMMPMNWMLMLIYSITLIYLMNIIIYYFYLIIYMKWKNMYNIKYKMKLLW